MNIKLTNNEVATKSVESIKKEVAKSLSDALNVRTAEVNDFAKVDDNIKKVIKGNEAMLDNIQTMIYEFYTDNKEISNTWSNLLYDIKNMYRIALDLNLSEYNNMIDRQET